MPRRAEDDPPQIGGVILALGGRPLVQHVIDAANASALEDIVLIADDDLVAHLDLGRTRVVGSADPGRGLAGSLQSGLRSLDRNLHAALVLLGDVPGVTTALIDELLSRGRETRATTVVSVWRGRRSLPVVLHKSLWRAALALDGDIGMHDLLAGLDDVAEVEVTPALGGLDDVATTDDHGRLRVGGDTPIAFPRSDGRSSAR